MYPFENLKEFIYGNLRPWLPENTIELKFKSLLLELNEYHSIQNLNYELKFLRHINFKTQFYLKYIEYHKFKILDELIPEIINETKPKVNKYKFNVLLTKQLPTFIKEVGEIIKEKNYDISYLDTKKNTFNFDSNHKSNTFIIQYLKQSAIHIYLELQCLFEIPTIDEFIEDDFYTRLLFEPVPDSSYIHRITKIPLIDELSQKHSVNQKTAASTIIKEPSQFRPIKGEISNVRLSKVNYGIIKNEDKFAEIETNLYEYGIIDIDYNFIKNKATSNNKLLAAIIKVLIEKNYFRRGYAGFKGTVKDNDIREYLENRYNTEIKQQFRKLIETEKELALVKLPWLDQLPQLR